MTQRSISKARASKSAKPALAPDTELDEIAQSIKSQIRETLLASPDFPRLYADVVISSAPNSNEAKILRANYQKIAGMNMPVHPNVKMCMHIKVTGVRCGSPALRGEQFCYFHQRMVRGVRTPPHARLHSIALIEDEEALQSSLMEIVNAIARNTIDLRRAELILRAFHIAVKNIRRVRFDASVSQMVKEVPDFAEPEQPAPAANPVGTAAIGCPGGPDVSGRSNDAAAPNPAMKKPSHTVAAPAPKERGNAPAPKEQKIAAHRISGG